MVPTNITSSKSSNQFISDKKVFTIFVSSQLLFILPFLFLKSASSSSKITIIFLLISALLFLKKLNSSFILLGHSFMSALDCISVSLIL